MKRRLIQISQCTSTVFVPTSQGDLLFKGIRVLTTACDAAWMVLLLQSAAPHAQHVPRLLRKKRQCFFSGGWRPLGSPSCFAMHDDSAFALCRLLCEISFCRATEKQRSMQSALLPRGLVSRGRNFTFGAAFHRLLQTHSCACMSYIFSLVDDSSGAMIFFSKPVLSLSLRAEKFALRFHFFTVQCYADGRLGKRENAKWK